MDRIRQLAGDKGYDAICHALEMGAFLAGGSVAYALASEERPANCVGDVDLFVPTTTQTGEILEYFHRCFLKVSMELYTSDDKPPYKTSIISVNSNDLKIGIQLICQHFSDPREVLATFDSDYVQCGFIYSPNVGIETIETTWCAEARALRRVRWIREDFKIERMRKASAKGFATPYFEPPTQKPLPNGLYQKVSTLNDVIIRPLSFLKGTDGNDYERRDVEAAWLDLQTIRCENLEDKYFLLSCWTDSDKKLTWRSKTLSVGLDILQTRKKEHANRHVCFQDHFYKIESHTINLTPGHHVCTLHMWRGAGLSEPLIWPLHTSADIEEVHSSDVVAVCMQRVPSVYERLGSLDQQVEEYRKNLLIWNDVQRNRDNTYRARWFEPRDPEIPQTEPTQWIYPSRAVWDRVSVDIRRIKATNPFFRGYYGVTVGACPTWDRKATMTYRRYLVLLELIATKSFSAFTDQPILQYYILWHYKQQANRFE